MKKIYNKPNVDVHEITAQKMICNSPIRNIESGPTGLDTGGGSSYNTGGVRAPQRGLWEIDRELP